jgi:hypothetical protein
MPSWRVPMRRVPRRHDPDHVADGCIPHLGAQVAIHGTGACLAADPIAKERVVDEAQSDGTRAADVGDARLFAPTLDPSIAAEQGDAGA